MKSINSKIMAVLRGALSTVETYPVSIFWALALLVTTWIRIEMNWDSEREYYFLFNSLQSSMAFGSIVSLFILSYEKSKVNTKYSFIIANILGVVVTVVTFLLVYLTGYIVYDSDTKYISMLAGLRLTTIGFITFFGFILVMGQKKYKSTFSKALFMTQKSFIISLVYYAALTMGLTSVAGAFQILVYENMSEKVYMYIVTTAFFLAYTIFVGYFPRLVSDDKEKREVAEKQPKFIEVLFKSILVPVMMALTVVLVMWVFRTLLEGEWPSFVQLSGIAVSYALGGIWLHMMVTDHDSNLTLFYKKYFPYAALGILAFQLVALIRQLSMYSLKTTEYYFIIVWLCAVIGLILIIKEKEEAHPKIVSIYIIGFLVSILPLVGYHKIPPMMQTAHLESILVDEGMLVGGEVVHASQDLPTLTKEKITLSVDFLADHQNVVLPDYLDEDINSYDRFEEVFGFKMTWSQDEVAYDNYVWTNIRLEDQIMSVEGYDYLLFRDALYRGSDGFTFNSTIGDIKLVWEDKGRDSFKVMIELDEVIIVEEDLSQFKNELASEYLGGNEDIALPVEELSYKIETPQLDVLIVFNHVNMSMENSGEKNVYMDVEAILIKVNK
jgi:hypothetical protein